MSKFAQVYISAAVLAILLYSFSLAVLANELTGIVNLKSLANVYLKGV